MEPKNYNNGAENGFGGSPNAMGEKGRLIPLPWVRFGVNCGAIGVPFGCIGLHFGAIGVPFGDTFQSIGVTLDSFG